MTAARTPPAIPGGTLLQGPSHRGGGNLLYVVDTAFGKRILKLYRRRRAKWREPWRNLGQWMEGKRGVRPDDRCRTEREGLALWRREGFDVPAVFDDALPEGVEPPALWLEYCPGPSLFDLVRDPAVEPQRKCETVSRFASELSRRQARAVELGQPLLSHEHPSVFCTCWCSRIAWSPSISKRPTRLRTTSRWPWSRSWPASSGPYTARRRTRGVR